MHPHQPDLPCVVRSVLRDANQPLAPVYWVANRAAHRLGELLWHRRLDNRREPLICQLQRASDIPCVAIRLRQGEWLIIQKRVAGTLQHACLEVIGGLPAAQVVRPIQLGQRWQIWRG